MNPLAGFQLLVATSTWLLTFAVHAAAMQAIALLGGRAVVRLPALRSTLWKTALLLPLVTATLATAGWRPAPPIRDVNLPELVAGHASPMERKVWIEKRTVVLRDAPAETRSFATDSRAVTIASIILALALAAAIAGIGRLLIRYRAFRQRLIGRVPLAAKGGMVPSCYRLTTSRTLGAPVALGRAEICVPTETFTALSLAEQRSILTHEGMHLRRRDPFWFAVADAIVALFPWQPFARAVVRQLRRDAEFCCDDAVVVRGEGEALVRSLVAFARDFDPAETALAASCGGSPLEERARRILAPAAPAGRWQSTALAVVLLLAVTAVAGAVPVVSTRITSLGNPAIDSARGGERRILIIDRNLASDRR